MYERYFKFRVKPFELVPNPDFLYLSKSHQKAITYLTYGLKERTGFMLLTGEVGAGKTTLIRYFIRNLDNSIHLSKVFNTTVSAVQLLAMINEDFGLDSGSRDKIQLVKQLYDFLIEEYSMGRQALLVIDEAQNLTPELLEEVRMLSNLETDDTKLLQILLVGQPELGKTLSSAELRQLRQRISIVCHLNTLNRQEMVDYIFHRLTVAGNRDALKFTEQAFDAIYSYSGGIPRLVNIICNLLLLTAFTEGLTEANHDMVNEIAESLVPPSYHQTVDTEIERKRALLNALGVPVKNSERAEGVADPKAALAKTKIQDLLKNMRRHVGTVEKISPEIVRGDDDAGQTMSPEEKGHKGVQSGSRPGQLPRTRKDESPAPRAGE
ncbi:MAG: XrtA/PEP-CTERM system-associated ATPase [Betaproteobacteria bacterium]